MVRGRREGDYGRAAKIRERQKMDGAVVAGGGTDEAVNSGCGDALSRLQEDRGETNEGNEI